MAKRIVAILVDDEAAQQIDLVRALYDREGVDRAPPHIPLTGSQERPTPGAHIGEILQVIVGTQPPFMLELAGAERYSEGEEHLLQFLPGQGREEVERLAAALTRDLFAPGAAQPSAEAPPVRPALTVGRFRREAEAERAAAALRGKRYFLVARRVGILDGDDSGGWRVERTAELGTMIAGG